MKAVTTPCSTYACAAVSPDGTKCQDLTDRIMITNANRARLRTVVRLYPQETIFDSADAKEIMLSLVRDGCFMTNERKVHCVNCHKTLSEAEAEEYCLSEIYMLNLFHYENCTFYSDWGIISITASTLPLSGAIQSIIVNDDLTDISEYGSLTKMIPTTSELTMLKRNRGNYLISENRQKSFVNYTYNIFATLQKMGDAGWILLSKGSAACFCCNVKVKGWNSCNNPWVTHAIFSPKCPFLRCNKTPEFIKRVQEKSNTAKAGESPNQDTNSNNQNVSALSNQQEAPRAVLPIPSDRDILNTPAAKAVMIFNYSEELVLSVIKSFLAKGETLSSLQGVEIMKQILPDDTDLVSTQRTSSNDGINHSTNDSGKEPTSSRDSTQSTQCMKSSVAHYSEHTEYIHNLSINVLQEENDILKEQWLCKVCFNDNVEVALILFGHLVCCLSCAVTVVNCPLCHVKVTGKMPIRFSDEI